LQEVLGMDRTSAIILLIPLVLMSCGTAETQAVATPQAIPYVLRATSQIEPTSRVSTLILETVTDWTRLTSPIGDYTVPVPTTWPIQDNLHGWVRFQDLAGQAGGDDGSIRGGIELPARYTGALSSTFALPNHAEPLFQQPITTPAGTGTLFTLRRDTPPAQNLYWFEQHAVIPAGDHFLVIWLKVPQPSSGEPVPILAHMLETLQRVRTTPRKPPLTPTSE
jgi:hypothetical protein